MTLNVDVPNNAAHKQHSVFSTFTQSMLSSATGISKSVGNFVAAIQVSRMKGVLNNMSNEQLKMIDVDRRDIDKHARFLVGQ